MLVLLIIIIIVTSGCPHTFELSVSSDNAQKYFFITNVKLLRTPQDHSCY